MKTMDRNEQVMASGLETLIKRAVDFAELERYFSLVKNFFSQFTPETYTEDVSRVFLRLMMLTDIRSIQLQKHNLN